MDNSPLHIFLDSISQSEAPQPQLTDELAHLYPYFTLPAALELKLAQPDTDRKQTLMARVALNAPNPLTPLPLPPPRMHLTPLCKITATLTQKSRLCLKN